MANNLSVGVNFAEVDNTLTTQSVGMWSGATVIQSGWGPIEEPTFIDSQTTLVDVFGKPNNNNYASWFCASNYLDYTASMYVVRSVADGLLNATTGDNGTLIKNELDYSLNCLDGQREVGEFAAKYAGEIGNSLLVTYADASTFNNWVIPETDENGEAIVGTSVTDVTVTEGGSGYVETDLVEMVSADGGAPSGYGASFKLVLGDAGTVEKIAVLNTGSGYAPTDKIQIESEHGDGCFATVSYQVMFDCKSLFSYAPSTSTYASNRSGKNDEMHLLVIDKNGRFTGTRYSVLESYEGLSKGSDCKSVDGTSNFYKRVLLDQSAYVYWMDYPYGKMHWGESVMNTTFEDIGNQVALEFKHGTDDYTVEGNSDANIMLAFDEFKNKEAYDITNVICGPYSAIVAKYVIESVCEYRMDCVAFVSPNNGSGGPIKGSSLTDICNKTIEWRNASTFNVNSSYGVLDSAWKYQYDKFNDEYRWIPLCADIAGLRARTSENQYPWFSEAGYNRGQIKNVVKLSFNPSKSYRDLLYPKGINPVVVFSGEGTILFGDKTLLTRPSAFQHTNVRFLFIYLEKTLTDAAKYLLFEINDEITRAYCKNLCEPFLDQVMGSRGIYAYKVVCDESNNTPLVIDNNQFAVDIYVQPARSINVINMRFIAEKTGSSMTTENG